MQHRAQLLARHIAPAVEPQVTRQHTAVTRPGLLNGQVAIVTGAAQGIGGATAKLFADEGAIVVVSDLDAAKSAKMAAEINSNGGKAVSIPGSVTDPAFAKALMKQTFEKFGKINILVNNAGYCWDGVIHKMSDKQWNAMLDVHCTGPFRLIREAAPYMRDAARKEIKANGKPEPRCIINISSTSGLHGNFGQANYATAKLGVVGLTKTVAKEWGPFGIRCNAVAFGFIETRLTAAKTKDNFIEVEGKKISLGIPGANKDNMGLMTMDIPLKRQGAVNEAAGGILLMASPYASYITGHCLEVTGGKGI